MGRVNVIESVQEGNIGDWNLCFQWCEYIYNDGSESEFGYRFIWKRPNGNLQAARGQARIPNLILMRRLLDRAEQEGWLLDREENN